MQATITTARMSELRSYLGKAVRDLAKADRLVQLRSKRRAATERSSLAESEAHMDLTRANYTRQHMQNTLDVLWDEYDKEVLKQHG